MFLNNYPRFFQLQSSVSRLFITAFFLFTVMGRAETSQIEQFLSQLQNLPESRRQALVAFQPVPFIHTLAF